MRYATVLTILAAALSGTCFAQPKIKDDKQGQAESTAKVIAEGVGTTADEALKDAFRNAVRQVVGALVDAETLVKNDEIISDKVLTYSAGYITKYDEISNKKEKGLFRVKISATVERRGIIEKLKDARVTSKEVDGKDIAAFAMTRKEARENATALLKKAFVEFPNVLVAEVRKPTAKDYDEDTLKLILDVTVKVDLVKYNAFAKNLVQIADKVSLEKSTSLIVTKEAGSVSDKGYTIEMPKFGHVELRGKHPKGWIMCLYTDGKGDRSRWNHYIMDSDPYESMSDLYLSQKRLQIGVKLLDKNSKVIAEDEFNPLGGNGPKSPGGFLVSDQPIHWLGRVVIHHAKSGSAPSGLSTHRWPLVGSESNNPRVAARKIELKDCEMIEVDVYPLPSIEAFRATSITYRRTIAIATEDLMNLKEVKCEVTFAPANLVEKK